MGRLSNRDVDAMVQGQYEDALANGEEWAEESFLSQHPRGDGMTFDKFIDEVTQEIAHLKGFAKVPDCFVLADEIRVEAKTCFEQEQTPTETAAHIVEVFG